MKRASSAVWTVTCAAIVAITSPSDGQASSHPGAAPEVARCEGLGPATVPVGAIGLPTAGARVDGAVSVSATAEAPAFCKVTGRILAADPSDPPILFEVNLPVRWNGKAVQFGGGGFNGVVVDGLGLAPGQARGDLSPLARGFVTYGGDSGHSAPGFDGRFALNAQALANYSGESVKRLHDAAAYLIRDYYGRPARRTYHVGGSKGGQEGLVAAQRYPRDFDGVVAFYPAAQNQALVTAWFNMWKAAYAREGDALDPSHQALLKDAVLGACDALDGLKDGVVANVVACRRTFAINRFRCPGGATGARCLSDGQIDALQVAATPYRFPFPLANGVTQIGPFPVYEGADLGGLLYSNGHDAGRSAGYHAFFSQVWPYFDAGDPAFVSETFNLREHQPRVEQISAMFDASDPNLDRFRAREGKLILVQGTTDMLVPDAMTTAYFDRLRARYGSGLSKFARYYVQPGYGHGAGTFTLHWDSLAALDDWVERGRPPVDPVAEDAGTAMAGRSMPLCEQPRFPRYRGTGDTRKAGSFECALP